MEIEVPTLVSYFTKEEIQEIYDLVLEISVRKYQDNEAVYSEWFQQRYNHAINSVKQKSLDLSTDELKEKLLKFKAKYEQNIEDNKAVIDMYFRIVLFVFIENLPKKSTDFEKLEYIFDFVTNYMKYSDDYYTYYVAIPPINGFDFDFNNTVPVDKTIKGLLVQRQGTSDDISNLIVYLGKILNIKIEKLHAEHNQELYCLNAFELENHLSLIDATRFIKRGKKKQECFLVNEEILNINGNYEFNEEISTISFHKESKVRYHMPSIVRKISDKLPIVVYNSSKKDQIKSHN